MLLGSFAASALSLLLVAPAPSYDPWSWLLWGREAVGGNLSTAEGPAFKPLPVAICGLLAPLGSAAPWIWVLLARVGALAALCLVFRLARRLAGGSVLAGLAAAGGLLVCGEYVGYSASGVITGLMLALALAGIEAWRRGSYHWAIACGMGCALLQVESWPFLLAAGIVAWRRSPDDRVWLLPCLVAVPLLWFIPELLGSGDLLRSAERAQIPNPGNPALAEIPAYASLRQSTELLIWPLWFGLLWLLATALRPRRSVPVALLPAAAGLAWISIVAAMGQAGFSGEPRYALPGVALLAVSGAVGIAVAARRLAHPLVAVALVSALAVAMAPRVADLVPLRARQAYQWTLARDLSRVVQDVGGREAVLSCGQPYVGSQRGPLMAYQLEVAKHVVEPDLPPRPPGMVFRSRLTRRHAAAPKVSARFHEVVRSGPWKVFADCKREEPLNDPSHVARRSRRPGGVLQR